MNKLKKEYKFIVTLNNKTKTFKVDNAFELEILEQLYLIVKDENVSMETYEKLYDIALEVAMKDSEQTNVHKLCQFLYNKEKENTLDEIYENQGRYFLLDLYYNSIDID